MFSAHTKIKKAVPGYKHFVPTARELMNLNLNSKLANSIS